MFLRRYSRNKGGERHVIREDALEFLSASGRRYLLATRRQALAGFQAELRVPGWQRLPGNPDVEVKLLPRSKPRRHKERAIRRKQRRGLAQALKKLHERVRTGRLKMRDKILEAIGRLKERSSKPRPMTPEVILRELSQIQIGDILLETTAGQKLALRRIARPNAEQSRILRALNLEIRERLSADRPL